MARFFSGYDSDKPNWRLDDDDSLWCLSGAQANLGQWVLQRPVLSGNLTFIASCLKSGKFIEVGPPAPYAIQTAVEDAW